MGAEPSLGERAEDRETRNHLVSSALSVLPEAWTWEVNNVKRWVTQKAFIFGFALGGVMAGSRSRSFTFLIRQIFR